MLAQVALWGCATLVFYIYVGYPVLIWWLARTRMSVNVEPGRDEVWPTVEVIIAMHNEANNVLQKVRNLRELDYPSDRIRITIVSDGSTDDTVEILSLARGVEVVDLPVRRGKPNALNEAALRSSAAVIVFTDARQKVDRGAIKILVAALRDGRVGAVSGALYHDRADNNVGRDFGLYWKYERWIRSSESRMHSTIGVTGALYAMRRELYEPIPEDTLLDDVAIPLLALRNGLRIVLAEDARAFDSLAVSQGSEWARKVRTLSGNFQLFSRNPWLFSRKTNPVFWQFLSHKVLRLVAPYTLVALAVLPWCLGGRLYSALGVLVAVMFGMGSAGILFPKLLQWRPISLLASFIVLNGAAVAALWVFLVGGIDVRWRRV